MLVLTRRPGQKIQIGEDITITVVSVRGKQVRIGVQTPPGTEVFRPDSIGHSEDENDDGGSTQEI